MSGALIPVRISPGRRAAGSALILFVGLLNFHIPHFLIETGKTAAFGSSALEVVFGLNVLAAVVAAAGIAAGRRWPWLLGIAVVVLSIGLYAAQETVGLAGLPKQWFEPSRIVALVAEVVFLWLATPLVRTPTMRATLAGG